MRSMCDRWRRSERSEGQWCLWHMGALGLRFPLSVLSFYEKGFAYRMAGYIARETSKKHTWNGTASTSDGGIHSKGSKQHTWNGMAWPVHRIAGYIAREASSQQHT